MNKFMLVLALVLSMVLAVTAFAEEAVVEDAADIVEETAAAETIEETVEDTETVEEAEEPEAVIVPEDFTGYVEIIADIDEAEIDEVVVLTAVVSGANMEYTVTWEMDFGNGEWVEVAYGNDFALKLTEDVADAYVRVVLEAR